MEKEKLEEICNTARLAGILLQDFSRHMESLKKICARQGITEQTMRAILRREEVYKCPSCRTFNVYNHAEQENINFVPPEKYICDRCGDKYEKLTLENQDVLSSKINTSNFESYGGC